MRPRDGACLRKKAGLAVAGLCVVYGGCEAIGEGGKLALLAHLHSVGEGHKLILKAGIVACDGVNFCFAHKVFVDKFGGLFVIIRQRTGIADEVKREARGFGPAADDDACGTGGDIGAALLDALDEHGCGGFGALLPFIGEDATDGFGRADHVMKEVDGVAAHIKEGPAASFLQVAEPFISMARQVAGEGVLEANQRADFAGGDEFFDGVNWCCKAVAVGDEGGDFFVLQGESGEFFGIGQGVGDGFFHQHGHLGFEGGLHDFDADARRGADNDAIQAEGLGLDGLEKLIDGVEGECVMLGGDSVAVLCDGIYEGDDADAAFAGLGSADVCACDAANSDDPEIENAIGHDTSTPESLRCFASSAVRFLLHVRSGKRVAAD